MDHQLARAYSDDACAARRDSTESIMRSYAHVLLLAITLQLAISRQIDHQIMRAYSDDSRAATCDAAQIDHQTMHACSDDGRATSCDAAPNQLSDDTRMFW